MGEYEDRYPDAYGREDTAASTEEAATAGQQAPGISQAGRERSSWRSWFGGGSTPEPSVPGNWQHEPRQSVVPPVAAGAPSTPASAATMPAGQPNYRGVGPRGYVRSTQRIYEDICDRLTEHPLIDASDIEVRLSGVEVTLAGSIDNAIAANRAEAIAREVPGVTAVHNALRVRNAAAGRP